MFEKGCHLGKHLYSKVKNILSFLTPHPNEEVFARNKVTEMYPELNTIRTEVSKNVMEYLMSKVYASL
jgi:hypothetical protein